MKILLLIFFVVLQFTSFAQFNLSGKVIDGQTNETLIGVNILWGIICLFGYYVTSPLEFYFAAGFIGLGMGAIQSLSRSTYSKLIDVKYSTSYFSFYDVSQKLSIVIGTAIYATMDVFTGSIRLAILLFALLFIPSVYLLNKISKK